MKTIAVCLSIGICLCIVSDTSAQSFLNKRKLDSGFAKRFNYSISVTKKNIPYKAEWIYTQPFRYKTLPLDNMVCVIPSSECVPMPVYSSYGNAVSIPNVYEVEVKKNKRKYQTFIFLSIRLLSIVQTTG